MSDWGPAPEPDPTIFLDFPWALTPTAYCGNCSEQVNLNARSHWGGCDIVYRYVSTRAIGLAWQKKVRSLRPDLRWRGEHEKPDGEVEFLKAQPVRPMFAHEVAAPLGEGRAGNYLAELRKDPPTFKANNYLVQAAAAAGMSADEFLKMPKEFRFPFYYGTRKPLDAWFDQRSDWHDRPINEHMKEDTPMKFNLTIEATDLLVLTKVVRAIDGGVYGAMVESVEPFSVNEFEIAVVSNYSIPARVHVEEKPKIREYLTKVVGRNSGDGDVTVTIEYVAEGTGERTTRKAIPLRIESREQHTWPYGLKDYLVLKDVHKDAMRSFLLDNIASVDGPVID